jgi:uncharacterized protein YecE (DUF72 family)
VSNSVFIGQSALKGSFAKYAEKLNLLEVLAEPHRLPKLKVLAEYKKQAPQGFEFSVVFSPKALEEGGKPLFEYGIELSKTLGARWVIVRSPSSIRPGSSGERSLGAVFEELKRRCPDCEIGWEPRGLWQGSARLRLAAQWGAHLVCDVHDVAPSPVVYVRLLRVGVGARSNSRLLEKLALTLLQAERGYVVVDGGGALAIRQELEEILREAAETDDDELDDDDAELGDVELDDAGDEYVGGELGEDDEELSEDEDEDDEEDDEDLGEDDEDFDLDSVDDEDDEGLGEADLDDDFDADELDDEDGADDSDEGTPRVTPAKRVRRPRASGPRKPGRKGRLQ